MNVRVNTDENDLINVLNHYIKNKDIAKLMFDTLNTNSIAIEWLFKLHIGNKYPKVPEIGTCGYIKLSNYGSWQGDKDKYLNSSYCETDSLNSSGVEIVLFLELNSVAKLKIKFLVNNMAESRLKSSNSTLTSGSIPRPSMTLRPFFV